MTAFLSAYTTGAAQRTDHTGQLGFRFTVGTSPLYVTDLGAINLSGSSGSRPVRIKRVSDNATMASVTLTLTGAGGFLYAAAVATLAASTGYYCYSEEASGVTTRPWLDSAAVTSSADGTVNEAVYSFDDTAWNSGGAGSQAYVPANFLYSLTAPGLAPVPPRRPVAVLRAAVR